MGNCMYCDDIEKREKLLIKVCEMPYVEIFLNKDQKHKGRCVVALDRHATEYHQLSEEERNAYFKAVAVTSKAIDSLYSPDKINYATYGDLMPHVHIHIVPKYADGLQWGKPFDDSVDRVELTEEEYESMANSINNRIVELLQSDDFC